MTNEERQASIAISSPAAFAMYASGGKWKPYKHLLHISEKLCAVAAGQVKRLIVMLPSRHGKSELISKYFPAWYLARNPDNRVILASYEAEFAASWGRKARDIVERYGPTFGVGVRGDSHAANRWDIDLRDGGMATAGVRGPITGKGAHVFLIDDPIKDEEEAQSATVQEKTWDWWTGTAYDRLEPNGAFVLVMTRWNVRDLVGRILEESKEKWEVLRLPAIAEVDDPIGREVGEALCPQRYPLEALDTIRGGMGSHWWAAKYQQAPYSRGGGYLQRHWFEIVDETPSNMAKVRYWDLAATEAKPGKGSDPDYTAGMLMGRTRENDYYGLDMRRLRGTPQTVERLIRQTAELDGRSVPIWIEQEPGSAGVSLIDHYQRMVLPGWSVRGNRETGSKVMRVDPAASAAECKRVKLVRGVWNRDFLDEAEQFPNGAHDDQVDAFSGAFRMLQTPNLSLSFV